MLRDNSIKSVVCKRWVVLWYFTFCGSFTCLPASVSIVMCSVSHCSFKIYWAMKLRWCFPVIFWKQLCRLSEIIGSWLAILSCMKLVPQFWWAPGCCCICCTPCRSTLDMFSWCRLPRQADLQVTLQKRGHDMWKLHVVEQMLNIQRMCSSFQFFAS